MNSQWDDWWDGIWLYFCIMLCSLPVAAPVIFFLRFAEANQAQGISIGLAAAYALIVGPLLLSRVFRSLDGARPKPAPRPEADPNVIEEAQYTTRCPHCGWRINPLTREGLHSPAGEPWLLICDHCDETIQPDV